MAGSAGVPPAPAPVPGAGETPALPGSPVHPVPPDQDYRNEASPASPL